MHAPAEGARAGAEGAGAGAEGARGGAEGARAGVEGARAGAEGTRAGAEVACRECELANENNGHRISGARGTDMRHEVGGDSDISYKGTFMWKAYEIQVEFN